MTKLRCKKCRAERGTSHRPNCEVVRHPWAFTDSSTYVMVSDTGSYGSSSSCDTSSSSSDSGGGGGDCG
jgi:hypothetical protein